MNATVKKNRFTAITRFYSRRASVAFIAVFLTAIFISIPVSWAAPTSTEQAGAVALNWISLEPGPLGSSIPQQVKEVRSYSDENGEPLYYVAFLEPSGLVFLPADDLVEPIIGFVSDATSFDPSDNSPLSALVSRDIPERVADARAAEAQAPKLGAPLAASLSAAQRKWAKLQNGLPALGDAPTSGLSSISDIRVTPFVQSKWDQTTDGSGQACYNYYTPPYSAGNANNYYSGCAATAMAQIMRWYQYPSSPVVGTFTVTVNNIPAQKTIRGGDGSGGAYDWSSMALDPLNTTLTDTQRKAIGSLTYDAGVSVNMAYASDGSAAWPFGYAFRNTFRYSNAIFGFNNGYNIPDATRNSMLNPNLNAQYPVLVAITGSSGGHAIVCDGYGYNNSTLYHHLNMGWSGTSDAWYNLPTVSASGLSFSSVYGLTYNIFKSCSGEIIAGRVTDSGGSPLSGVTVKATLGATTYNAVAATSTTGHYAIPCAPSNSTFTVAASKSGYIFSSQSVTTGTSIDNTSASGATAVTGNKNDVNFTGYPDTTGPSLSITSHTDGQYVGLSSSITLSGTATDSGTGNSGIQKVTVNGTEASNDTATGANTANWSYNLTLSSGSNSITVIAYDNSTNNNSTTKTITIYLNTSATAPSVSTPVTVWSGTGSATLGATISSNGGATVTASGIAYGTSPNPTTSNSTTSSTAVSGAFSASMSGLSSNTLYYYRGFATNTAGTSYTADSTFTTVPDAPTATAASNISKTGFTANWTAPSGTCALSYRIDVSIDPGFSSFVGAYNNWAVNGTSLEIDTPPALKCYYRVRAVNAGGTSANSATIAVNTGKLDPAILLLLLGK